MFRDLCGVYQQLVGRRCKRYLGDPELDVVEVQKEHQSSRNQSRRSLQRRQYCEDIVEQNTVPICRHLLEPHLKEDLPEFMPYFVY